VSSVTSASRISLVALFSGSLVITRRLLVTFPIYLSAASLTSIVPLPPAGISLSDKRVPVQPHPARTLSIMRSEVPRLKKVNTAE